VYREEAEGFPFNTKVLRGKRGVDIALKGARGNWIRKDERDVVGKFSGVCKREEICSM
jgi:hypothetical protein